MPRNAKMTMVKLQIMGNHTKRTLKVAMFKALVDGGIDSIVI